MHRWVPPSFPRLLRPPLPSQQQEDVSHFLLDEGCGYAKGWQVLAAPRPQVTKLAREHFALLGGRGASQGLRVLLGRPQPGNGLLLMLLLLLSLSLLALVLLLSLLLSVLGGC